MRYLHAVLLQCPHVLYAMTVRAFLLAVRPWPGNNTVSLSIRRQLQVISSECSPGIIGPKVEAKIEHRAKLRSANAMRYHDHAARRGGCLFLFTIQTMQSKPPYPILCIRPSLSLSLSLSLCLSLTLRRDFKSYPPPARDRQPAAVVNPCRTRPRSLSRFLEKTDMTLSLQSR